MKLIYTKKGKCQNCKENDQDLYKVIYKGKNQAWCDACIEGVKISIEERGVIKNRK